MCIMPSGGQCTQSAVKKLHSLFPGLKMVFHFYGSTEVPHPKYLTSDSTQLSPL